MILAWAILTLGLAVLVIAALGVLRLGDALAKQHAATKAATVGLGIMLIGMAVLVPRPEWLLRLAALGAILLATLPLASHALALAAMRYKP
jgi:multicomponent Na+:H+ antiporter subunit G